MQPKVQQVRAKASKSKVGKRRNRSGRRASKRRISSEASCSTIPSETKDANAYFRKIKNRIESETVLGMRMWRQTYETAVQWHQTHQVNFWRQQAVHLKHENDSLKQSSTIPLRPSKNAKLKRYETSDSESENDDSLEVGKTTQGAVKQSTEYAETDDDEDNEELKENVDNDNIEEDKDDLLNSSATHSVRQKPPPEPLPPIDTDFLDFLAVTYKHRQELQRMRANLNI